MSDYISKLRPAETEPRGFNFGVAGQSLARAFTNRSSFIALDTVLRANAPTAALLTTAFINQVNTAKGGTVADRYSSNNPAGNVDYWYDSQALANGPLLTAALATIGATVLDCLYMNLGQTEALYLPDINSAANYKIALRKTLDALLVTVTGPLIMSIVGRREAAGHPGIQLVREMQLEVASDLVIAGKTVRLIDDYDLPLVDEVHPSNVGYATLGNRVARAYLNTYAPPAVLTAVMQPDNLVVRATLSAPITLPIGSVIPGGGVRLADGAAKFVDGYVISSTVIDFRAEVGAADQSLLTAVQLMWPYGKLARAEDNLAALPHNSAGDPVRSVLLNIT
jgi:hypothetical protein